MRAGRIVLAIGLLATPACSHGSDHANAIAWIPARPSFERHALRIARPCRAADLHAELFLQGATGSIVGGVILTRVGRSPCSLIGRPAVHFAGPTARKVRWRIGVMQPPRSEDPFEALRAPSLRALRSGDQALVGIAWSNWCGPPSRNRRPGQWTALPPRQLILELPAGRGAFRLLPEGGEPAPRCDAPEAATYLSVSRFTPRAPDAKPAHLPLRVRIQGGKLESATELRSFEASPGKALRYHVALENVSRRQFRFRRCPIYKETLVDSHENWPTEWFVLNCKPVGALEPGERAVFEIVFQVPRDARPGRAGITWSLAPGASDSRFDAATVIVR